MCVGVNDSDIVVGWDHKGKAIQTGLCGKDSSILSSWKDVEPFFFALVGQPIASSLSCHSLLTLVFAVKEAIKVTATTLPLPAFLPYYWGRDISKEPLFYSKQELTPLFFWVTLGDVNIL